MTDSGISEQAPRPSGFDLHGLVGIQVLGASPAELARIGRQLGLAPTALAREPDVRVRLVDQLPAPSRLHYLGLEDVGFTDDAFWILRGGRRARAQIPVEHIGRQCEIVCERGARAIPFLAPVVRLTALARGALPVHASAFVHAGTGVLVSGWSRGGKTGALLTFMAHGAGFVSDDWVYLAGDGRRMHGTLEPIEVSADYLRQLPQYRQAVGRAARIRLGSAQLVLAAGQRLAALPAQPPGLLRRLLSALNARTRISLPPQQLFGQARCALAGDLSKILLTISHASPEVNVQPIETAELAGRLAAALQHEWIDFMTLYHKFRYAFPGRANALIEGIDALQREQLRQRLGDKQAYLVYHPYPAPLQAMFEVLHPLISA